MARKKRNSKTIENAQRRLESLQSIDSNLDFGTISLAIYTDHIEQARNAISHYNTLLSLVDEAQLVVEATERQVTTSSTRLLRNVSARYGEDSVEYVKAGGKIRGSKPQVTNSMANRLSNATGTTTISTSLTNVSAMPTTIISNAAMNKKKTTGAKAKG
jgi:hypothetical protein